jgi:hypothetical protein
MGGVYEIRPYQGLKCHDMYTKFCKDWLMHSKFDKGIYRGEGHRIASYR